MSQRLTQKERQLLNDQLSHEKICIEKYRSYAQQVSDPQLSQLLNQYAAQEQEHYDTLTQLLQGQATSMSQSGGGLQSSIQGGQGTHGAGVGQAGRQGQGQSRQAQGGSQAHAGGQYGTQSHQAHGSPYPTLQMSAVTGHGSGSYGWEGPGGGQSQQARSQQARQTSQVGQGGHGGQGTQMSAVNTNNDDAVMLTDLLMTEKFISSAYDTAIFESANSHVRQALQHIQDEEQQHGEGLYNYMSQHGMYMGS